jgi:hypothetical protein
MRDMSRLEILEMASNMIEQAKIAQKSIQDMKKKFPHVRLPFCEISDSKWAKLVYNIVRSGVSIIEITTHDLKVFSEQDFTVKKEEENENDYEDDYEEEE